MINYLKLREAITLPKDVQKLSPDEYSKALGRFRIVTVETAVFSENGKILLIKREEDPAQGEWWICGTRLIGGESLVQGSQRAIKTELNLDIDQERIKIENKIQLVDWPKSSKAQFGENLLHCIARVKLAEQEGSSITLRDHEHSEKHWVFPEEVMDKSRFLEPLVDICGYFSSQKVIMTKRD